MKKILLTLFALTVFGQMYSQNENDIVVIRVLEDTKPTTRTNRSVALCPVECLYHTMTSMLELTFQPGLGEADVTLDNLSTGEGQWTEKNLKSEMKCVNLRDLFKRVSERLWEAEKK